jgi:DNA-binding CsgD family transcriptional regulator
VNQRARLLTDAVKGSIERISRAADGGGNSSVASLLLKGRALSYAENYEGARDLFALVRNLSAASDANWSETARYFAADNEIRAGNFRSAIALIDEMTVAVTSQQYHRGMRNNLLLWRAHAAGDELGSQSRLAEAQRFASADTPAQAAAQLFACQGQFALMRGDLAEAGALLARAAEIGMAFANPALLRCESDLVEVLVRSGRRREAARTLTRLEYRSAGLKSRWLRLAVSRSRALVAEGEQSLGLFVQALETWQKDDSVFERARTLLCYAERLKAAGWPKDAKNSMLTAKALFEEAGAAAWTQQVDTLLLGDRVEVVPELHNPALLLLSDHERELVQLVARGRRNKEIAASLFVSVRTVEVRLTGIYRKLRVQSRSQLTSLVSGREPLLVSDPARETSPLAV